MYAKRTETTSESAGEGRVIIHISISVCVGTGEGTSHKGCINVYRRESRNKADLKMNERMKIAAGTGTAICF